MLSLVCLTLLKLSITRFPMKLSYSAVFHITNEWNRSTTIVGMVSNALWFNSSIVSFGVFVSDTIQAKKEKEEQERSHALIFDNDIS